QAEWNSERLRNPVMFNDQLIPYTVFAVYVMPGTRLRVGLVDATGGVTATFAGAELDLARDDLRAPETPGLAVLEIRNTATGERSTLNVFVMVPASSVDRDGRLNGYRIGSYPSEPLRGLDIYLPPKGFVEVTADNAGTRISPNFTLGQFVAKQAADYPKYVVLRASLLLKLENILANLNESGHPVQRLVIMSGYRTPFYNRAIGNTRYSRHVWGGAADFYIDDSPRDGNMDDLNGDGRVDREDARWLANFVDAMSRRGAFGPRIGGIGVYGSNSAHGPFVHVDVRGTRARW
ncbi:MAG: D-Ala-D-Ala carboxypeptidase family metallohydrolase, partial [Woeseiaceae bacterium]|nr:D-Ala-D-Ala carboxypeptidase family metallohydrolase [Woeseiaceae bacterium]